MKYLLLLLTCGALLNCSNADTLGDEPPVTVTIPASPTYANGVGELLDLKCGYCHAYPKPDVAPDNIVADLDLTTYETRIQDGRVIRGADGIGRYLADGLLDHELNIYADNRVFPPIAVDTRAMPLDYGTPVTEEEKAALRNWSELGSPKDDQDDNPQGDISAGAAFWGNCNYCHGIRGEGFMENSRWLGPPLRAQAVTIAKIQSMWLWRQDLEDNPPEPMSDEDAANLRAFILDTLTATN